MTETDLRPDVRPDLSKGDTDATRRAHIVKAPPGKDGEAWVTEARVMGLEVEALCGKKWVPQRDPARFPVCEVCRDILAAMP